MSSPLFGAGYLRAPKTSGTKEEVLAMLKKHVMDGQPSDGMTGRERLDDKYRRLHELAIWRANEFAGPRFEIVGPLQRWGIREDERFRNYIGRYGAIRND